MEESRRTLGEKLLGRESRARR